MKYFDLRTPEGRQLFYQSSEWRKLRAIKITNNPLCEICLREDRLIPTTDIHHLKDIKDDPSLDNALNYDGLQSLCRSCHSKITRSKMYSKTKWEPFNLKEWVKKNVQA